MANGTICATGRLNIIPAILHLRQRAHRGLWLHACASGHLDGLRSERPDGFRLLDRYRVTSRELLVPGTSVQRCSGPSTAHRPRFVDRIFGGRVHEFIRSREDEDLDEWPPSLDTNYRIDGGWTGRRH